MSVELSEQEKKIFTEELIRLNNITNELWKKGLDTNFCSMSHTEYGIVKYENIVKINNITSIVPSIFDKKINKQKKNKVNVPQQSNKLQCKRNYKSFMNL